MFKAEKLLDSMTTAVIVLDDQFVIRHTNNAAAILLGQSSKRLEGCQFFSLFRHFSVSQQKFEQTLFEQKGFTDSEVHAILADTRPVLLELKCTLLVHDDQHFALIECQQIDQQKRIIQESQNENQHQAARHLVRGLAHEIKNPLGGIRGAAQLLQRQLPTDELKEFTAVVIEQSDRLQNLVDRLLGPNKPPTLTAVNIHLVLDKTLKLIGFEQKCELPIKRDYDPSIPEIKVDGELLQQALINIIRNAVQAMKQQDKPPLLTICTRIKQHQTIHGKTHKMCLEIKIIDNGPGIPAHLTDTLFFPLISGSSEGTGLGLSISQTLIHQHDGRIDCDSWPGHTEFTLTIPFKESI